MNSSSLLLLPSDMLMAFHELQFYYYLQVSSLAILAFDYCITFSDEVEHIWTGKPNLARTLFFITRYLPFIDGAVLLAQLFMPDATQSTCQVLYHVKGWLNFFSFLVANSIFVLRTYAIWKNIKRVAIYLFALLVACTTGAAYYMEKFTLSLSGGPSPSRSAFPGCFVFHAGRILWVSFSILLVFHNMVLFLTVLRVIKERRLNDSSLFRTIYRDGIMVYAYLLGISLINIIVLNTAPITLEFSLISFHRVLHAILTGRLVINIRRAMSRDEDRYK